MMLDFSVTDDKNNYFRYKTSGYIQKVDLCID